MNQWRKCGKDWTKRNLPLLLPEVVGVAVDPLVMIEAVVVAKTPAQINELNLTRNGVTAI